MTRAAVEGAKPMTVEYKLVGNQIIVIERYWTDKFGDAKRFAEELAARHNDADANAAEHAALLKCAEALRSLLRSAIVLSPEYLEIVSRGMRDDETVQGWHVADWKRVLAAYRESQAALASLSEVQSAEGKEK